MEDPLKVERMPIIIMHANVMHVNARKQCLAFTISHMHFGMYVPASQGYTICVHVKVVNWAVVGLFLKLV